MPDTYMTAKQQPQVTSYAKPAPVFPVGAGTATNPTTTSVSTATDTSIVFANTYNRLMLQNNSSYVLYYAFDQTAGTGMFQLQPGQTLIFDTSSTLHLYQASGGTIQVDHASTAGYAIHAFTAPSV